MVSRDVPTEQGGEGELSKELPDIVPYLSPSEVPGAGRCRLQGCSPGWSTSRGEAAGSAGFRWPCIATWCLAARGALRPVCATLASSPPLSLSASRESLSNPRSRGREPSGNAAKTPRITFQGLFAVAKVGLALKAGAVFAELSSQFKDLFPLSALKMVFSTFILCHQI